MSSEASIAIQKIANLIDERAALSRRIAEITDDMQEVAIGLCKISDRSDRLRAIRLLYWEVPEVNVNALCAALFLEWDEAAQAPKGWPQDLVRFARFGKRLRDIIGAHPTISHACRTNGCAERVPVTSRTQLFELKSLPLCPKCEREQSVRNKEYWDKWDAGAADRERQRIALRSELNALKDRSQLSDAEIFRLYELLATFHESQE